MVIYSLRDVGLFDWWKKPGDLSSQYADDIALLVLNVQELLKVLDHIQYVGKFTGLSLNLDKTIAFNHKSCSRHVIHGIQMDKTPVKYLGAYLGVGDLSHLNFEKPLYLA